MGYITEYDKRSPQSIEAYARRLIGKTFREIIEEDKKKSGMIMEDTPNYGTSEVKEAKRNKGNLGQIIEERFFHYKCNSDSRADFYEAGVELKVTPYNSGTNEFGESVGYGKGESKDYEISNGDIFYEDFYGTLVQNPKESEIPNMIGLLFKVISLDEDNVTLLINQEERTIMYGEEFVVYSLLEVRDGASTGYRMQITP